MTKPKPANPTFSISAADLASALAQIGTEIDHQPLRSSALARIMRETFHGTTTRLYLLTGLLLPIWKDIPTTNERIYRVTPDGATAMIGRTLSEEGAAALRARFLVSNPQTPQEMLTAALGTTAPVDLGRGLTLTRRRVAGEMRLELCGVDRGMIDGLKALGCFTEIIAFQLRVFLPHGDGIDTGSILARIVGHWPDAASVAAE